jgi:AhpD family alkylhydroperoxidase
MQPRLDYVTAAPAAYRAVLALDRFVSDCGVAPHLLHLIKIRASQLNGCAYCVDMHVKEARQDGHDEQWVALIATWQESPRYTPEERAVLGWTEALTQLPATRAPDADYAPLRALFSDQQIVELTVAISTINVWNRIGVGFRLQHPIDPR